MAETRAAEVGESSADERESLAEVRTASRFSGFGDGLDLVIIGFHNFLEILFEPPSDGFGVLIDDQALAMSHHQSGLAVSYTGGTHIEHLVRIHEDFLAIG